MRLEALGLVRAGLGGGGSRGGGGGGGGGTDIAGEGTRAGIGGVSVAPAGATELSDGIRFLAGGGVASGLGAWHISLDIICEDV